MRVLYRRAQMQYRCYTEVVLHTTTLKLPCLDMPWARTLLLMIWRLLACGEFRKPSQSPSTHELCKEIYREIWRLYNFFLYSFCIKKEKQRSVQSHFPILILYKEGKKRSVQKHGGTWPSPKQPRDPSPRWRDQLSTCSSTSSCLDKRDR